MGIPAVCAARTTRATLSEPPMLPGLIRTAATDRKSTRLNSSHSQISYAVFCLKKKKGVDPSPELAAAGRAFVRGRWTDALKGRGLVSSVWTVAVYVSTIDAVVRVVRPLQAVL